MCFAEEDQDETAEGEEEQDEPAAAAENMSSRQLFNLLRGQCANTAALACDLLGEEGLQQKLRVISGVLGPLHKEFSWDLAMIKPGQESMMTFAALRTDHHYYLCVQEILNGMLDTRWQQELDLCPPSGTDRAFDANSVIMRTEAALLQDLFNFSVHLASARCWSQAFYSLLFPYIFAGVYLPDPDRRRSTMRTMGQLADAVLALEDYTRANPSDVFAASLLSDLATNKWQVTREMWVSGVATGWSCDDAEMQQLAWACFSGPASTKDALEMVFGYLKDSLRSTKNRMIKSWTQFMYVLASPYAAAAGIKCILPSAADFVAFLHKDPAAAIGALNPFQPRSRNLDQKIVPEAKDVAKIRPAGFHANRDAAAASAYLHAHVRSGQPLSEMRPVWPGCLARLSIF